MGEGAGRNERRFFILRIWANGPITRSRSEGGHAGLGEHHEKPGIWSNVDTVDASRQTRDLSAVTEVSLGWREIWGRDCRGTGTCLPRGDQESFLCGSRMQSTPQLRLNLCSVLPMPWFLPQLWVSSLSCRNAEIITHCLVTCFRWV